MKKLLILALVVVLTAVGYLATQTDVLSRKHVSTTVVQIHPLMIPIHGSFLVAPAVYLENECEGILSDDTITKLVGDTKLDVRWNTTPGETRIRVEKMVTAMPWYGTNFIEIIAGSDDREEAREISQGLADAYIARRNELERKRAEKALKILDDELESHRKIFEEKRTALSGIIGSYGIPYFEGSAKTTLELNKKEGFRRIQPDTNDPAKRLKPRIPEVEKLIAEGRFEEI